LFAKLSVQGENFTDCSNRRLSINQMPLTPNN